MLASLLVLPALVALSVQAPAPGPRYDNSTGPIYGNGTGPRCGNGTGPLTFGADGTFQVSIFQDLHFGENAWDSWGPQQDANSLKVMNAVLDREAPRLVVLNGDLITGENTFLENSTAYVDQIVAPLVARGLPWASAYGNHDHNFNLSAAAILAREQRWPNARTRSMVPGREAGVSNYYLPVYAPECAGPGSDVLRPGAGPDGDRARSGNSSHRCQPELLLWFFDSRGGFYFQERNADGSQRGQPDWVDVSVVDWFRRESERIAAAAGRTVPSLAFVHIPTSASLAASMAPQKEHGRDGIDAHLQPGINADYPLARQGQGWCADGRNGPDCAYGGQDVPFMEALAATPGLMALFSGHDHGDTWCYRWKGRLPGVPVDGSGISLCFGQHSGYGGYGNWVRGARQVRVHLDRLRAGRGEADTWIRLETGTVVGSVTLNSTYGRDWYPATPDDKTYCPTCDYNVITPRPQKESLA